MSALYVRRARPTEARDLRALRRASVRGLPANLYPEEVIAAWSEPPSLPAIKDTIAAHPVFVADQGLRVVGFGALDLDRESVSSLYVLPEQTRKGVATALMDALEMEARRAGIAELVVEAPLHAVAFCESCGYRKAGSARWAVGGELSVDAVRLQKTLR